ncbi:hypothetical protein SAMN02745121_05099 [Nannocystis exedens]|uniref:Uncharacterized protein n=1 Tax=Nannocystis exedens TaxID=54 RepID=A0A1I2CEP9_9BACT|nr:hypothetical protein [Nannocystis exedens]PCC68334.1 hypothetical protein NAEX_01344 [Nannocystis exedens]SFE66791.1 hypothetical protein SAMN02745121_05099 [Nannocystis exedens]
MTDERRLDPFLDAAVAEAERAATRPPPSFAAVLARAHSLAPDAVPPPEAAPALTALPDRPSAPSLTAVPAGQAASGLSRPDAAPARTAERSGHSTVDTLARPAARTAAPSGHAPVAGSARRTTPIGHAPLAMSDRPAVDPHAADLAPFLAAARGLADADVAARLRRPPPPLPRPRSRVPLFVFAAAAALLLVAGASAWRRLADPARGDLTGAQADDTVRDRPRQHQSEPRAPRSPDPKDMSSRTLTNAHSDPSPAPDGQPSAGAQPALAERDAPLPSSPDDPPAASSSAASGAAARPAAPVPATGNATAAEPAPSTRKPAGDSLADELARLDDEAEALLLAGALDDADARYRQMIAIGGRRSAVEHAFADRWLLARRRGDDDAHRQLLQAYLLKFPRGRFADEASAGLCRLADADARTDCWRAYRERFPGGAYRREADEAAVP